VAFYLVVLYALSFGAGYVSKRHVLPPALLTLGFVAAGAPVAGRLIASGLRRLAGATAPPPAWLATAVGVALIVGFAAPKTLGARRPERLAERRAAEWLREQPGRAGAVAAVKRRVAYYAGAAHLPLPNAEMGPMIAYLRANGAGYLIVDDHLLEADPALQRATREGMRLLHTTEGGGRRAAVFTLRAPPLRAEDAAAGRGG
jgi:hypothetical protein